MQNAECKVQNEEGERVERGYPGSKGASGVRERIISLMPVHDHFLSLFLGHGAIEQIKRPAPGLNVGYDVDAGVIEWWANHLRGAGATPTLTVLQGDALQILTTHAALRDPNTLVYLDPPYLRSVRTRLLYNFEFAGEEDHWLLLCMIRQLPCRVMISGYQSPLYAAMLEDWRCESFPGMTRGGVREEHLWMNFPAYLPLHDGRFVGKNYRERWRIKKKTRNWQRRLAAMPEQERQVIRDALDELASPPPALRTATPRRALSDRCDSPSVVTTREVTTVDRSREHGTVTGRGNLMIERSRLLLSIFPGIDLLGRAFEAEGYTVVRGPDLIYGGDVRSFSIPRGIFAGIIGGSPCPDWSRLRRTEPTGQGAEMMREFCRIIEEGEPDWFMLENVPGVPDLTGLESYRPIQRIDIDGRECGLRQRRLRHFQFGSLCARPLVVERRRFAVTDQAAAIASEGTRVGRRGWREFCALQGLPPLELPGWSIAAKYRAVGNGVPTQMGRLLARSILSWTHSVVRPARICGCGCGRAINERQTYALACCRKRMQRRRDSAGVAKSGRVTAVA